MFNTAAHRWDEDRQKVAGLRIAPARCNRPDGPPVPGIVMYWERTRIHAVLTREEALLYADAIHDCLDAAEPTPTTGSLL